MTDLSIVRWIASCNFSATRSVGRHQIEVSWDISRPAPQKSKFALTFLCLAPNERMTAQQIESLPNAHQAPVGAHGDLRITGETFLLPATQPIADGRRNGLRSGSGAAFTHCIGPRKSRLPRSMPFLRSKAYAIVT